MPLYIYILFMLTNYHSVIGPPGEMGRTGLPGPLGLPGMDGLDGAKGQQGDKGADCTFCPNGMKFTEDHLQ